MVIMINRVQYVEIEGWLHYDPPIYCISHENSRVDLKFNDGDKKMASKLKGQWVVICGNLTPKTRVMRVNSINQ